MERSNIKGHSFCHLQKREFLPKVATPHPEPKRALQSMSAPQSYFTTTRPRSPQQTASASLTTK